MGIAKKEDRLIEKLFYSLYCIILNKNLTCAPFLPDNRAMNGLNLQKSVLLSLIIGVCLICSLFGENDAALKIEPNDAYLEYVEGEGIHLYVRKKPGLGSILITDSSADPEKKNHSYSLRAYDYNIVNGDELRVLNGEFIDPAKDLFFLIDSTPEYSAIFDDQAFHILIPFYCVFGYPWSREGQVEILQDSWLNIRTFSKPYGDHDGGTFQDNPFTLQKVKELPKREEVPSPPQLEDTKIIGNRDDLLYEIDNILSERKSDEVDLVLVLDTTISMKDNLDFVKKKLVPLLKTRTKNYTRFRIGVVFYRDYKESYLTREFAFTTDFSSIEAILRKVKVAGGRDKEEAVNEGIFSAVSNFDWVASDRIIIQIGDALGHKEPKGAITKEMVLDGAMIKNISIYPILLP